MFNKAIFDNREQAGAYIAQHIIHPVTQNVVVVAIPKGGIPVSLPIADKCQVMPMVCPVTRVFPAALPEWSLGAMSNDGTIIFNYSMQNLLKLKPEDLSCAILNAKQRIDVITKDLKPWLVPELTKESNVFIVDDGTATGLTALAAFLFIETRFVKSITLVSPILSMHSYEFLTKHKVSVISRLITKEMPFKTRYYYHDFHNITIETCRDILKSYI